MRLKIFKAKDGDCCLLTGSTGTNLLVDGGRSTSYEGHVADELGAMRARNEHIDRLVVSHIDDDHISGVLRLLDHEVAWRVHEHQVAGGNTAHAAPSFPRPPEVDAIWHNGFADQVGGNAADILDQLAASVPFLSLPEGDALDAADRQLLVLGEESALRLRRRIADVQLDIAINPERDGRVMGLFANQTAFQVGGLSVALIGPYFEDLETLRAAWEAWLQAHAAKLDEIQGDAQRDEQDLGLEGFARWHFRMRRLAAEIGTTGELTPPNVASIMFLVREGARSVLFTGDGGHDVIIGGLENAGLLRPDGSLHVDVLKVPHHGSEHNISVEFAQAVTADHYVFCSNGANQNPNIEVLEAYMNARLGPQGLSTNPEAGRPFTCWFTYAPTDDVTTNQRTHMTAVRNLVDGRAAQSNGRMTVRFVGANFEEIDLS